MLRCIFYSVTYAGSSTITTAADAGSAIKMATDKRNKVQNYVNMLRMLGQSATTEAEVPDADTEEEELRMLGQAETDMFDWAGLLKDGLAHGSTILQKHLGGGGQLETAADAESATKMATDKRNKVQNYANLLRMLGQTATTEAEVPDADTEEEELGMLGQTETDMFDWAGLLKDGLTHGSTILQKHLGGGGQLEAAADDASEEELEELAQTVVADAKRELLEELEQTVAEAADDDNSKSFWIKLRDSLIHHGANVLNDLKQKDDDSSLTAATDATDATDLDLDAPEEIETAEQAEDLDEQQQPEFLAQDGAETQSSEGGASTIFAVSWLLSGLALGSIVSAMVTKKYFSQQRKFKGVDSKYLLGAEAPCAM